MLLKYMLEKRIVWRKLSGGSSHVWRGLVEAERDGIINFLLGIVDVCASTMFGNSPFSRDWFGTIVELLAVITNPSNAGTCVVRLQRRVHIM